MMARTYAGQDPEDLQRAFEALQHVRNFAELDEFVAATPIVRTAAFAAMFRQIYLQSPDSKRQQGRNIGLYQGFFTVLHFFKHRERCASVKNEPPQPSPSAARGPIPPFYGHILRLLNGRAAPCDNEPADPQKDLARIKNAIEKATGAGADLPRYEPTPGAKWTLLSLRCARCSLEYSTVRVHAVDLAAAPALREPLREGRINVSGCPRCGELCAWPLGAFVEDPPFPGDPLASFSCAIRVAEDFMVYQPPPGTVRHPDLDRVLEIRFGFRIDELGWQLPKVTSMRIVYTREDLAALGDRPAAATEVPRAMEVHIADIASKIRSGALAPYDAEQQINRIVPLIGADWPIIVGPLAGAEGASSFEALVQFMTAEAVAQARGEAGTMRALITLGTAAKYLEFHELAASERKCAQAEDILQATPRTDPRWQGVARAIRDHRADLMVQLGRHDEAEKLRRAEESLPSGDTSADHLAQARRNAQIALAASEQGRLDEAFDLFPRCVEELQRLVDEDEAQATERHRAGSSNPVHDLSGAIANYGALLAQIADNVEVAALLYRESLPADLSSVPNIDPKAALSVVAALRSRLLRRYPGGFYAENIRIEAVGFFQRAIKLAQSISAWDFAAIQAYHLMMLHEQLGKKGQALEYAELTIEYAERAHDRNRASGAYAFLSRHAAETGKGAQALEYLKKTALIAIQNEIAAGHHAEQRPVMRGLGVAAIGTARSGADSGEAITLVENLKAALMAPSLVVGFPVGASGEGDATGLAQDIERVHRERERARIRAMWQAAGKEAGEEIAALDARLADLHNQLSLRDSRFAEWVDASTTELETPSKLRRHLATLGERAMMLGIFMAGGRVTTYLIGQDGCWLHETAIAEQAPAFSWHDGDLTPGSEIILSPFLPQLRRMRPQDRLIISPDVGFFDLPLAALPFDGVPLCAKVTLSVVQGAGVLGALRGRRRASYSRVVTLGGPQRMDQSDLPGARLEAQRIAEIFAGADSALTGRKATVRALIAASADADVLHIACHAEPGGPMQGRSCLLLTPDLQNGDSGVFSEDRILYELKLPTGCLVNLAGCTTAAQNQTAGPLLGGLVPAFQVCGSGAVLASVRPIADGEATVFQEALYRRLVAGTTPSYALAETQRLCLDGGLGAEMSHMQAWAPYVLYSAN
jgi:tetratricopeptide (TPR) repeat protein